MSIETAHTVAIDEYGLDEKFHIMGCSALMNVIENGYDYVKILGHLQFFRKLWTGELGQEAKKEYLRRHT